LSDPGNTIDAAYQQFKLGVKQVLPPWTPAAITNASRVDPVLIAGVITYVLWRIVGRIFR
jgi:hypothetical protein